MKENFSLQQNFSLKYNDDGSTSIEGFAIHGKEGFIVNGFFEVPETELKNCARTLKGAKLMKDHDTNHVDAIIGRVNQTKKTFDESADMEGVFYNASLVVDDTKLAEKIDKGLIDATSIGFTFEPECSICGNNFFSDECSHHPLFDDMHFICRDMNIHELSLVTFGADPHASVMGSFDANELNELKEKFTKEKEDFIMSKEDNVVETLKSENLELSQKVSDLEAQLEQQKTDFSKEQDALQNLHDEEVLTLQQEKKALETKMEEMTEELSIFRAEAEAKLAERLKAKQERVIELAQSLDSEDLLKEEKLSDEEYLDEKIAMFERVDEKIKSQTPQEFTGTEQHHKVDEKQIKEHVPFAGVSKAFHIAHRRINAEKGD